MIRNIVEKDIPKLIDFNTKVYKHKDNIEESFKYRFIDNPILNKPLDNLLISQDEKGEIKGQFFLLPTEFWFEGKKHLAFWGMDFIVSEEQRGSYEGVQLAMKVVKTQNHFGVNMTKPALKIHLALKEKIIGYLPKYIRIINILSVCKSIIYRNRSIRTYNYPQMINVKGGKFIKIHEPSQLIPKEGFWNHDVVEFTRDEKFINWRFFHYRDKYHIYKYYSQVHKNDENPVYFVIRPIIWKNLECIFLVDYRFQLNRKEDLDRILKATIIISRKLRMAATLSCSSLPKLNKTFRKNRYISYGKNTVILTNLDERNFGNAFKKDSVFVTFADSDSDLNYGN